MFLAFSEYSDQGTELDVERSSRGFHHNNLHSPFQNAEADRHVDRPGIDIWVVGTNACADLERDVDYTGQYLCP